MKNDAQILETYLRGLASSLSVGVKETSQYTPFVNLFNEVGSTLKPKVICHSHPRTRGAGIPDCGLFTADQIKRRNADAVAMAFGEGTILPERGVIEIKPIGYDLRKLENEDQTRKYWQRHHSVLLSNYRAFSLIGTCRGNPNPVRLEEFELAASEAEFRELLSHPRKAAEALGARLLEFIRRVMLHPVRLTSPQDVAALLASYARDALDHVENADPRALEGIKKALGDALGLTFPEDEDVTPNRRKQIEIEKGAHFFRSALVQTLFYGMFSAWVVWCKRKEEQVSAESDWCVRETADAWDNARAFNWRMTRDLLHLSVIGALFDQIDTHTHRRELGLAPILDNAARVLDRVERIEFFHAFAEDKAVQFFYEPFLAAFDPELRKQLGVWYTPPEIVKYMVGRVHKVLQTELGLPDGLADPRVVVLDPCCGTGAYLVETVNVIAETLKARRRDDMLASDLKRAVVAGEKDDPAQPGTFHGPRILGFEILPAPFVIAHLQLELLLQKYHATLAEDGSERCGVYLTNALTGWNPPDERPKQQVLLSELQEERDAAEHVKRDAPILVVIGNPPYNAFAGVSPDEEEGLVDAYKQKLNIPEKDGGWGIRKFNLDDLYIRFFRLAERRIAEGPQQCGVVCFISNHSWVTDPSFVVLRKHLLRSFDRFWIENMHGDRRITEYAPDGRTSETVFAIPGFSPGIRQGVVISLWMKRTEREGSPVVLFRDDLEEAKAVDRRARLLDSLSDEHSDAHYKVANPDRSNRFSFCPSTVAAAYLSWPKVMDLCAVPPFNGPVERRAFALISMERNTLAERMSRYFDKSVSNEEVESLHPALMMTGNRIVGPVARAKLLSESRYEKTRIVRYPFKPFDVRWSYLDNIRPLFSEPSPKLLSHRFDRNAFLVVRESGRVAPSSPPMLFSHLVCDYHALAVEAKHIPFLLTRHRAAKAMKTATLPGIEDGADRITANLSAAARTYLVDFDLPDPDTDQEAAAMIWLHALAIGYSPAYLNENADGLRQDWPRIPLPEEKSTFLASAALGRRVATLLDTETPVSEVTSGSLRSELASVARITHKDGKQFYPERDFAVTAGWGHAGKSGVTMPGRGKVTKYGADALNIWLNEDVFWQNVPKPAWDYVIGGYQVLKKWLSYRAHPVLGRSMSENEVGDFRDNARRLTALTALHPALDENYHSVVSATFQKKGE